MRPPPPPDITCGFLIQLVFVASQLCHSLVVHGGTGGSGGRSTKKYSRKGKLNEKKNHAPQLTLKNIHAMA